ncbi:MAG: ABC transporter [Alphaproteobacteria bacterium]|nr:ABC transporter [Alphaproteobacteria bacterium]
MRRGPFAIAASLLAVIIFAGLNLAANKWLAPARLDFTESHLYTLSSSARTVIRRLVEPVDLELVLSREAAANYPAIQAHAARVREMLAEIAARSNGKIRIHETDPAPFSADEDRITAAGLTPAPSDGGDPLYFGVIGRNSVDDVIAISYLAPQRDALLEYDLIRLIAQLDDPAPAKVAVISSLPAYQGDGTGEGDALILREMRRAYQVRPVAPDFTALPAGTDVLVIVQPPKLNDWQLYQIDQFLLRKGRALIALDPVSRIALMTGGPRAQPGSSLGKLETSLGIAVGSNAVADRVLALPVNVDAGGGRQTVEGQPLFIAAPPALMASKDLVTEDLTRPVNFGAPGQLVPQPSLTASFTPLIETTPDAALVPAGEAAQGLSPRDVLATYKPVGRRLTLAARLSGNLVTAFPDGPPARPPEADPALEKLAATEAASTPPQIKTSATPAEIVMIGDSDVFDDSFYVNPQGGAPLADNAAFILNALDNLTGDEALVKLRSRAPAARPMKRVDDMREAASERLHKEQAALQKELSDAQAHLSQLEAARKAADDAGGGQRLKRSDADSAEIETIRRKVSDIRSRLRAVQRDFRSSIDQLAGRLELFNVWLPPLLIAGLGLGVFAWRSRRRAPPAKGNGT